jgi:hypothetical protein
MHQIKCKIQEENMILFRRINNHKITEFQY